MPSDVDNLDRNCVCYGLELAHPSRIFGTSYIIEIVMSVKQTVHHFAREHNTHAHIIKSH